MTDRPDHKEEYSVAAKMINQGQLDEGFQRLHELQSKIDKQGDLYVRVLLSIAVYFSISGKYKTAEMYLTKVAEECDIAQRKHLQGYFFYTAAMTAQYAGDYQKSIDYLEQGISLYREGKDYFNLMQSLINVAELYFAQEAYEASNNSLAEASQCLLKMESTQEQFAQREIKLFRAIGRNYFYLGNLEMAIEMNSKALANAEKSNLAYDILFSRLRKAEFLLVSNPGAAKEILDQVDSELTEDSDKRIVIYIKILNIAFFKVIKDEDAAQLFLSRLKDYLSKYKRDDKDSFAYLSRLEKRLLVNK